MAIRKPASRFTDRNKMRKMHAEGYSIAQIAAKLSIVDSHVEYCLTHWDVDSESNRDKAKLLIQEEHENRMKQNQLAHAPDLNALREQIRHDIMAELAKGATAVADAIPSPAPVEAVKPEGEPGSEPAEVDNLNPDDLPELDPEPEAVETETDAESKVEVHAKVEEKTDEEAAPEVPKSARPRRRQRVA